MEKLYGGARGGGKMYGPVALMTYAVRDVERKESLRKQYRKARYRRKHERYINRIWKKVKTADCWRSQRCTERK